MLPKYVLGEHHALTNAAMLVIKLNRGQDTVSAILRRYPSATLEDGSIYFRQGWNMKIYRDHKGKWRAADLERRDA